MSAVLRTPEARLETMTVAHLDAVCAVEHGAYSHPWTRANFIDSLAVGYHCQMLVGPAAGAGEDTVIGYFIAMKGVDEVHLLNLTIAPDFQRQGWALLLLDALAGWSRGQGARWLWLEVRASNARAMHVYERQGFQRVGLRKGYYPAHGGREDAVVMSLRLDAPATAREGRPA
jgi:ribosomal-protein-alanine N-acetyltransferase